MKLTRAMKSPADLKIAKTFSVLFLSFMLALPAVAWSKETMSRQVIKDLYQAGSYTEIVKVLGGLETWSNYQSLYLGLSHLRLGNSGLTIRAWKNYVRLEKGSEGARKVSKYLSILIKQEAQRTAKIAVDQEKSLSIDYDPKTIAVSPFQNLGDKSYNPLSKGLAEMIISDLSNIKGLTVVERIQMQAVLNELKLAGSSLVDQKNAPRLGKLLGASRVTTGSFLDFEAQKMRLDATVTRTENGQRLASSDVSGPLSSFYQLEKTLVFKILCGIGHCRESLDSRTRLAVEKVHTKNLVAFQHFSEGLDFFDQGKYPEASRSFFLALEEDPRFALARKALLNTPIVELNLTAILAGVENTEKGESVLLDFQAMSNLPQLAGLPRSLEGNFRNSPVPFIPEITQQTIDNGGAGSPARVPVQIEIQLP